MSSGELFLAISRLPPPPCRCLWAPGFAGETGSPQSSLHALCAVAFADSLVSRVGSSLATGAIVSGDAVDLSSWMVRNRLLDGVFDSGLGLQICTYIRMRLGRDGAHASSIVSCPRCIWSKMLFHICLLGLKAMLWHCSPFRKGSPVFMRPQCVTTRRLWLPSTGGAGECPAPSAYWLVAF